MSFVFHVQFSLISVSASLTNRLHFPGTLVLWQVRRFTLQNQFLRRTVSQQHIILIFYLDIFFVYVKLRDLLLIGVFYRWVLLVEEFPCRSSLTKYTTETT
jgi:hypothetical protein